MGSSKGDIARQMAANAPPTTAPPDPQPQQSAPTEPPIRVNRFDSLFTVIGFKRIASKPQKPYEDGTVAQRIADVNIGFKGHDGTASFTGGMSLHTRTVGGKITRNFVVTFPSISVGAGARRLPVFNITDEAKPDFEAWKKGVKKDFEAYLRTNPAVGSRYTITQDDEPLSDELAAMFD